jgi:hypothetical protein
MSFTSSADNIHLDNGVLYASLQKRDCSWSEAFFDLNEVLENDDRSPEPWRTSTHS